MGELRNVIKWRPRFKVLSITALTIVGTQIMFEIIKKTEAFSDEAEMGIGETITIWFLSLTLIACIYGLVFLVWLGIKESSPGIIKYLNAEDIDDEREY